MAKEININFDLNEVQRSRKSNIVEPLRNNVIEAKVVKEKNNNSMEKAVNILGIIYNLCVTIVKRIVELLKYLFSKKYFVWFLILVGAIILFLNFFPNTGLPNITNIAGNNNIVNENKYTVKIYKGKSNVEPYVEVTESKYKEEKFISIQSNIKEDKTLSLKIVQLASDKDSAKSLLNKASIKLLANQAVKYQVPSNFPVGDYEILLFEGLAPSLQNEVILKNYSDLKKLATTSITFKVIE